MEEVVAAVHGEFGLGLGSKHGEREDCIHTHAIHAHTSQHTLMHKHGFMTGSLMQKNDKVEGKYIN